MKKPIFNRIISAVLCLAMLLPMVPVLSFSAAAAGEDQSTPQTHTESTYLDGVHYHIEKSISYIGNRSYQLNVKLHTSLTDTDIVLNRNYARNGYFTVEVSGWYLLELWGGIGAKGGDSTDFLIGRPGGNGGARGYVYAKVYLEKGQTLAYSIGTDGKQSEIGGVGGGVNGSGGGHGDKGSQWVGGGGGYSALYFFDAGEFDPSWLTAGGYWQLPSSVRLSRYVMIAAGGGGGGAGNGTMWVNAGYANGGAGGNINNGVSMTLNGAGGSVPGYLFFGKNGESSGASTAYIGRGGTNTPGKSPSTSGGQFTAEPGPNDWSGAYNLDSTPGAGGSGMFRGGGGGAGFCGGSGGIMTGQAVASNVGGGGGGSSFLATEIGGNKTYFDEDVEKDQLLGAYGCPSKEGGAFSYTFLGNEDGVEIDTTYLQKVLVQGSFSQYFDIFASPSTDGTTNDLGVSNPNGELIYDAQSGAFTVTDASIDASSVERDGTLLSMTFLLKAKTAFIGGNNVPLLKSLSITMDRGSSEPTVIESKGEARTDNVNVPLSLSIPTHSKMISRKEGDEAPTFKIADLYVNEHTDTTGWAYDFVSGVSSPIVYTGNQGTSGSRYSAENTPAITETTYYSVTMNVTPKTADGYAACGPKNEGTETFVGVITLTVLDATVFDGEDGWSYDLTANKTLSYNGNYFIFEQSVTQSMTRKYELASSAVYNSTTAQNGYSASSYQIQKRGYYLLQVWGGNGGKGGNTYVKTPVRTRTATGGAGGAGAAVFVFAYLEEGDVIHFTLGSSGNAGTYSSDTQTGDVNATARGGGGGAGYASAIALQKNGTTEAESTYILIAGGGGGGAGSGAAQGGGVYGNSAAANGSAGAAGSSTFDYEGDTPVLGSLSDFEGTAGTAGTASTGIIFNQGLVSASSGTRGLGGVSYCDTTFANVGSNDAETLYIGRLAETLAGSSDFTKPTNDASGAARVSFICDDQTTEEIAQFPGVEAGGSFSRYFEVPTDENGVPMLDMSITGVAHDTKEITANDDGSITVCYYDDEKLMAQFSFVLTEENSITSYEVFGTVYHPTFRVSKVDSSTYIADCGFTISIALDPREGFLGGNDVPVLEGLSDGEEYTNVYVKKDEALGYLRADNKADYANVAVDYDVASCFAVKEGYVVLEDGNTDNDTVYTSDLYTLNIDLSGYADWQKEFVVAMYPEETAYTLTYYTSTTVSLTGGLVPKAAPQKAIIIGNTEGARVTLITTVYAQYPIDYQISHLEVSGPQYVTYSKPTTIRLQPEQGFLLPVTGEVKVLNRNGGTINFTYDEATGVIEIAASEPYSPITVRAAALPQPFKLHYVFTFDGVHSEEVVEEYQSGQTIDTTFIDTFLEVYNVEEREGHTFSWNWETEDGLRPTTMPGNDLWVVGGYKKDRHTLTIHYVDGNGASVGIDDYTAVLEYDQTYAIPTPSVDGYMPHSVTGNADNSNPYVISGQMKTEDINVTVTYAYAKNQLVILYLYPDGQEISRIEREIPDGESFEEFAPEVAGYIPGSVVFNGEEWEGDPACITGTMPVGGSILVQVYYKAERYAVDLEYRYEGGTYPKPLDVPAYLQYDFTEAVLDSGSDTIYIEYGNIFGYNPEEGTYGLPTPIVAGYTFAGWYTDTAFTQRVEEDLSVGLDHPTKLYAKWEPEQYKMILRFMIVEGQYMAPNVDVLSALALSLGVELETKDANEDGVVDHYYLSLDMYLDESYQITLPEMVGYTSYLEYGIPGAEMAVNEIVGQMPAFNRICEITYEINSYLVQFYAYGGLSHVTFPTYTTFAQDVGPFEVDTYLTEAMYEHAEPVIYPEPTPNQAREFYTFVPDWWENATGEIYPADLVATKNDALYAHYVAHENIATVYQYNGTDVVSHHHLIQDAVDAALAIGYTDGYEADSPIIRLHRFEDVVGDARDIQLSQTVIVGAQEQSKLPGVRLDLNGLTVRATDTAFTVRYATLYIVNSSTTQDPETGDVTEIPASIIVESDSDVVAIRQDGDGSLSIGSLVGGFDVSLTVEARSASGNAIGVYSTADGARLNHNNGEIIADAQNGNAYGIWQAMINNPTQSIYYLYAYGAITVNAKGDAYAIKTNASTSLASGATLTVETLNGTAIGVECSKWLDCGSASGTVVSAHSQNGNAYGIYATHQIHLDASLLTVEASSDNADATAIFANEPYNASLYNIAATATAPNGKAIAMHFNGASMIVGLEKTVVLHADGREAIAFSCNHEARVHAMIEAIGTERAIAIYNPASKTSIGDGANILAYSPAGNAYAVYGGSVAAYNPSKVSTSSVVARTETGNAYGLYSSSVVDTLNPVTIYAEATDSGNAYGFYVAEGVACNLYQSSTIVATAPLGRAYGAFVVGEASLLGSITSTGKTAYGVGVDGHVTAVGNYITVTGEDQAYGIASINGGSVLGPQSGLTITVDVTAEGGTSYGMYAENGGQIGNAPVAESFGTGEVLATATGGGIGYALWAETGSIYITGNSNGNPFYYKGTSNETRRNGSGVIISAGFVEILVEDASSYYNGYYYLKVQGKYQMVFIGLDLQGNELGVYATLNYTPGVGFDAGYYEPSAPVSSDPGYTGIWEEYDFSAPDGMPETPDLNTVYTKYVYSTYVRNKFWVYVYYEDNGSSSGSFEVTYLDPVLPLLAMGTREKTGYVFNGVWTCNGEVITEEWTMPANHVYIYAQWQPDIFEMTIMTGGIEMSFENVETLEQSKDKVVIRGEYQTYLNYSYVAPGYTLEGFYTDPTFKQKWNNYSIPAVEEGEEFIVYVKWIESLSVVIMGPLKTYTVMVNAWIDQNGDGKMDTGESMPFGTFEDLFGAEEGETLLDPFNGNSLFGMTDVSPIWAMTFLPEEIASQLGARYRIVGWCAADGRPIKLASGVGSWGIEPDGEGLTQIYARLEVAPEKIGKLDDIWMTLLGSSDAPMLPIPRDTLIFNRHFNFLYLAQSFAQQDGSDLGGYTYNSYKALTTGEHVIYLSEVGSDGFYTQYEIVLCKQDGSKIAIVSGEEGKLPHRQLDLSFEDESKFLQLTVDMEAGDTLLMRSYQLPNAQGVCEDGGTVMLVSLPGIHDSVYDMMDPDGDNPLAPLQFYLVTHCATDFFFYGGSMGTIDLPLDWTSSNPAFDNVSGWAISDETMTPTSQVITAVSPDLLQDPSIWIDMDGMALLFLLPEISESTAEAWIGAIVADRHFDPAVLPSLLANPLPVVVRGAAAVTFRFDAKMPTVGEQATLFFTSGLPVGTTLTLIDLSTKYPTYYNYVVAADGNTLTTLALSAFTLSGGDASFEGCSKKMMFNICYPNGQAPAAESISIGITETPADIELSFTSTETNEMKFDDKTAEDHDSITETLTIPALTGRGYKDNDEAVLVLRLYDEAGNVVPLPAGFLVEPTAGTLRTYSNFAYASLGKVRYFSQAFTLAGKMHLSTLRYLGFAGRVVYEVIVLPEGTDISGANFGGVEATVDTRISCNITVEETPDVLFSENYFTVAPGDSITVSAWLGGVNDSREIELYILQRARDNMIYTEYCADLLQQLSPEGKLVPVPLDENGKVPGTLTTGEGTFHVSETAKEGVYFVVVYYHDRYSVCTVVVTKQ